MPPDPLVTVRVRVPAKVNLFLQVGAVREDGFHELVTVFQAVDLLDEITATTATGLEVRMRGLGSDELPTGPDNLAWQAASLLAEQAQVAPDVRLEIDKAIPVAGGMAGGSADAAATLVACAALWQLGTGRPELLELAARLGSDVAFPLAGGTALGTGRGEVLTPVLTTGRFHWVFALADFGISAGAAYRELDRQRAAGAPAAAPGPEPDAVLDALRAGDPLALAASLHNDLQVAALALAPQLRTVLDAGLDRGALGGLVSGSGPTVALLAANATEARRIAATLTTDRICPATRIGSGPVGGARVVAGPEVVR